MTTHHYPVFSSPTWGRIKEGEASEGSSHSCTGFPLPNPPPYRGRGLLNPSAEDRAEPKRRAPTLTLPRLGGGEWMDR